MHGQLTPTGALFVKYSEVRPEQEDRQDHYHDAYEIVYFSRADFRVFVHDSTMDIRDGDLLLIGCSELHRFLYTPQAAYHRHMVNFMPSLLMPFLGLFGLQTLLPQLFSGKMRKVSLSLRQQERVVHLFDDLLSLWQNHRPGDPEGTARCVAALFLLLSAISRMFREAAAREIPQGDDPLVTRMTRWLDGHVPEDICLDDMARAFSLSRFHLCHVFREQTGFSPFEYLQHRRILEARRLLRERPDLSVTEICYQTGFSNIQHFYKVFRRLAGTTPRQFRLAAPGVRPEQEAPQ